MQPIRIAVGEMPRLLREIIISSLTPHSDLEVVEVATAGGGAEAVLGGRRIDVLILSADGARLNGMQARLLHQHPPLRILALDGGGRQAALYELRAHRIALEEVSTEGLAGAIRAACRQPLPTTPIESGRAH